MQVELHPAEAFINFLIHHTDLKLPRKKDNNEGWRALFKQLVPFFEDLFKTWEKKEFNALHPRTTILLKGCELRVSGVPDRLTAEHMVIEALKNMGAKSVTIEQPNRTRINELKPCRGLFNNGCCYKGEVLDSLGLCPKCSADYAEEPDAYK